MTESKKIKNKNIVYAFWFFLGLFGGHRFYLKQNKDAAVMLRFGLGAVPVWFIYYIIFNNKSHTWFEFITFPFKIPFELRLLGRAGIQELITSIFSVIFLICFVVIIIWWVLDAFRIAGMTEEYNNE